MLSEYENQLLEDHGIYAITSPIKEVKYVSIKRDIDYLPHLHFPEGPRPCWTHYNTGTCPDRAACTDEDNDAVEKYDFPYLQARLLERAYLDRRPPSSPT